MSEYDHETSTVRRPWPTGGCCAMGGEGRGERFHFENLTKPINTLSGKNAQFELVNWVVRMVTCML